MRKARSMSVRTAAGVSAAARAVKSKRSRVSQSGPPSTRSNGTSYARLMRSRTVWLLNATSPLALEPPDTAPETLGLMIATSNCGFAGCCADSTTGTVTATRAPTAAERQFMLPDNTVDADLFQVSGSERRFVRTRTGDAQNRL